MNQEEIIKFITGRFSQSFRGAIQNLRYYSQGGDVLYRDAFWRCIGLCSAQADILFAFPCELTDGMGLRGRSNTMHAQVEKLKAIFNQQEATKRADLSRLGPITL